MKKFNFKQLKFHRVNIQEMNDRLLLINLYITQLIVLLIAAIVMFFQKPDLLSMFSTAPGVSIAVWGVLFALAVLAVDLFVSQWVPPEVTDDGGINEMLFRNRPLWHIALISLVVSLCEELLFRGAIQASWGPYWTSILFAAIHVRYLQHWLMTGLVFSISYGLGWIYIQTGSLWTPIVAHFLIDFTMGCILRYRRES
ncbi:type II CAAX endopeptidase family protein [Paenibacillus validus]|uniref:CPBP family intramembrane metalloprotease n=1 Tax=Paenibacillus validus TaxID=44253 RepID=A0A7X2ZB69_9BACL|nr:MULTISPECIES: type II CAAX endopeptidase family protein [Paenibacillus]MED4602474.1 type II CAAX endopeptidase family protein [Paenibacillus validus]MED4608966.1 type II CAAX endopeptidase family protein [Paenibacillus validus]MUG71688.1 CPBP family intramembrane metalloprotease [Paenibacillus validus]